MKELLHTFTLTYIPIFPECTTMGTGHGKLLSYLHRFGLMDKGKSVPLQDWSGPVCSRKLWFPDFVTTAQDGGKIVSLTHRPPLSPGNTPGTHFC